MKLFVSERRSVAVVESDRAIVADDAPGAIRQISEVIPELIDGRSSVELVVIQIGVAAFEFDDGDGFLVVGIGERAERAVGGADARDVELFLPLVCLRGFGDGLVAERFSEDVFEEIAVEGGFLVIKSMRVGELRPFDDDGVGLIAVGPLPASFRGLCGKEAWQEERAMLGRDDVTE